MHLTINIQYKISDKSTKFSFMSISIKIKKSASRVVQRESWRKHFLTVTNRFAVVSGWNKSCKKSRNRRNSKHLNGTKANLIRNQSRFSEVEDPDINWFTYQTSSHVYACVRAFFFFSLSSLLFVSSSSESIDLPGQSCQKIRLHARSRALGDSFTSRLWRTTVGPPRLRCRKLDGAKNTLILNGDRFNAGIMGDMWLFSFYRASFLWR